MPGRAVAMCSGADSAATRVESRRVWCGGVRFAAIQQRRTADVLLVARHGIFEVRDRFREDAPCAVHVKEPSGCRLTRQAAI